MTPMPRNRRWRRGWPRATARGRGSKRPGGSESAARAHRGISPPEASQHRGGPAAHPGRQTGLSGHTHTHTPAGGGRCTPLTGPHAHRHLQPGAAAGPGERSPAAYRRPPQPSHAQPYCAPRLPRPAPLSGLRGHCSTRGRHRPTEAGRRHPREARPARSQTVGNRGGGRGHRRSHTRDEEEGRQRWGGAGKHTQQGPRDRGKGAAQGPESTRDTAGPPGKPARDPTATHTRGRSRDAWDAGRSWPSLERAPHPGPAARAGVPSTHLPPSTHPSHPSATDPSSIKV